MNTLFRRAPRPPLSRLKRGFTLTEVIIAMTISVAIGGTATWFLVEGTKASLKAANTSIADLSQWSIFTAISVDSKVANGMAVYRTFTAADMADSTKRVTEGGVDNDANPRGNVLILTRSAQGANSKFAHYEQITGYVYSSSTKLLRKFTYEVPVSEQGTATTQPATLEQILNDHLTNFAFQKVAGDLVTASSGGVFLVRKEGSSGILAVQSEQGGTNNQVSSKKLIEASFFIRG